jgi:polysaccharidase protein
MPTTYYVDSVNGSDGNSGLSVDSALRSLNRIESVNLLPGDQVLFARGSAFQDQLDVRYSGTADAPIIFGSYGFGELPVFSGPNKGIVGVDSHDIVVQDIRIANAGDAAFYATNATNWTIQRVVIENTGLTTGVGGIFWRAGTGLAIRNSTFNGIHGDGIYLDRVNGASVTGNAFYGLEGANADGIQVEDSVGVSIASNTIDMASSPNSTKGGIVVNRGGTIQIADNDITGGSFGLSVTSQNVTIRDNNISGQTRYSWSASVLVGGSSDAANYLIEQNAIHDSIFGVALTASGDTAPLRQSIEITGNSFDRMSGAALKVDRPSSGSFHGNTVSNSTADTRLGGPFGSGSYAALTSASAALVSVFDGDGADNLLFGTTGEDHIRSRRGNDTLDGGTGADRLDGGAGDDQIHGGDQADSLFGEDGADVLDGQDGNDRLFGNEGADTILGGEGDNTVVGGQGAIDGTDSIVTGGGLDFIFGNGGADAVGAGDGNNSLVGGFGIDTLTSGGGADLVFANQDNDVVATGDGADSIWAGLGNDLVLANQGNDLILGNEGNDTLFGGAGGDLFAFAAGSGNDQITGFVFDEGDRITLQGQGYTLGSAGDGDAVLILSGGGTIELNGIAPGNFSPGLVT